MPPPKLKDIRSYAAGVGTGVAVNLISWVLGIVAALVWASLTVYETYPRAWWRWVEKDRDSRERHRIYAAVVTGLLVVLVSFGAWWIIAPDPLEKHVALIERYPESWMDKQRVRYPQGALLRLDRVTLFPSVQVPSENPQRFDPVVKMDKRGVALRSLKLFLFVPRDIDLTQKCSEAEGVCWVLSRPTEKYNIWAVSLGEVPFGTKAGAWGPLYLRLPRREVFKIKYSIMGIAILPNGNVSGLDMIDGEIRIDARS
jgi:MFS family permease